MTSREDRIGSSCWYQVGHKWATGTVRAWLTRTVYDEYPNLDYPQKYRPVDEEVVALVEYGPDLRVQYVPVNRLCFAAVPPGQILEKS